MKNFPYFLILFFCACSDKIIDKNDCFYYPSKIEELNSRDLYDSARWILFNWLGPQKLDDVYYGQMELRYKDVLSRNDTIEIFFQFYVSDTSSINKTKSISVSRTSVAFRQGTRKRLWAFHYPFADFSTGLESGNVLLESPLSDTAIQFLKSYRNIINNCYLQLAKKQRILAY